MPNVSAPLRLGPPPNRRIKPVPGPGGAPGAPFSARLPADWLRASLEWTATAGSFESARSGFADYARDGESAKELRARVNRTILEDLEAKVLALRSLHAKLRDADAGLSFGGGGRPVEAPI